MRHRLGLIAAVLAAFVAATARAQEPESQHWPLREINFPVSLDKIQAMNPRPSKVRFHVARDRGRFEREAERTLADLDVIDAERSRRGFRYTTPADGEYSFSIQLVYADGDVNPRDADLVAHRRVIVDTRPPQVRIAAVGTSGVEWEVVDDHARPDSVELQVKYKSQPRYTTVTPRAFGLRDRYTWTNGLSAQQPLEVRVVAKDRAGHEGISRPITLPTGGAGTGLDRDTVRPASDRTGTGFGNPDDFPNRPEISYVNSRNLTVESKLRVTRSGVRAVHLWVNEGKAVWRLAKTHPAAIAATDPNPTVRIEYPVEKDGLYGFIAIPENGAGGKQDDPRPGDLAQFLIEVDTDRPFIKVKGHKVSPGGTAGPRVEIEWEATDKNLWEEPITLEYATDKVSGQWQPITPGKVRNSGRYVWEVENKDLWRVYVRATALDKASNRSEHVYEKEIVIDLEKPAATIEKVQGSGGAPPAERGSGASPVPAPASPVVPPAPSPVPSGGPITLPGLPEPLPKDPGKG